MGACSVSLGCGDYDGCNEFQSCSNPKSRKDYQCYECKRLIAKGEIHEKFTAKYDGKFSSTRTCMDCVHIRSAFVEGAMEYGMWSEVRDYLFPEMTMACVKRVETVSAKKFLLEQWRKWKGLAS